MFNYETIRERMMKGINTTRLLSLSFALAIFIGAILLSLPISNVGEKVPFIEHLFTAVSATCVTGLLSVNVANQYSFFGHIIIILLMQIGGLGLMTFFILFLSMAKKHLFIAEKKLVQDSLSKANLDNIPQFIFSIIKYTFIFEGLGFIILCFRFIPDFGFFKGIFNALFLAVSSFCNAGIDNFSLNSLEVYQTDIIVNFVVCTLIIIGGLGFTVWFELLSIFKTKKSFKQISHHFTLNTKLVLKISAILIGLGAFVFLVLENDAAIKHLNFVDKIIVSLFNSVTLRTAGFSNLPIGSLRNSTLLMMCILMFIGGSPGGTAGGIKTTTLGVLLLSLKSIYNNRNYINYSKKEINQAIVNKAFIVFIVYMVLVIVSVFVLLITDEAHSFIALLFETISAIGTVGLSTGITASLSVVGKIVIMLMMYIGRVGPITIILSTLSKASIKKEMIRYTQEDVLIG